MRCFNYIILITCLLKLYAKILFNVLIFNFLVLIYGFPLLGFTLQASRTNNKRVTSTFNFGYPRLTMKEGPKVKSVQTRRFSGYDISYMLVYHPKLLGPKLSEL